METKNKLGCMPTTKLIINMSLPLMFSLLIQSLYNIVGSIFVARLGQDALLSRSIGAKDAALTGSAAATGVLLSLLGTAVFMLLAKA